MIENEVLKFMEITERQIKILKEIIKEYINSARPVSSSFLEKKLKLGIKAPTIRLELQRLTEKDLIFQPYTSGGRVPTDKGFRFWINDFLLKQKDFYNLDWEMKREIEKIIEEEKQNPLKMAFRLTKFLSRSTSSLSIFYLLKNDLWIKEGWEDLMKGLNFEDRNFVSLVADFLNDFKNYFNELINEGELNKEDLKIFIGEENKNEKAKNFSIIISKYLLGEEEGIISLVGTKRMPYQKSISLLNYLRKLLLR